MSLDAKLKGDAGSIDILPELLGLAESLHWFRWWPPSSILFKICLTLFLFRAIRLSGLGELAMLSTNISDEFIRTIAALFSSSTSEWKTGGSYFLS